MKVMKASMLRDRSLLSWRSRQAVDCVSCFPGSSSLLTRVQNQMVDRAVGLAGGAEPCGLQGSGCSYSPPQTEECQDGAEEAE